MAYLLWDYINLLVTIIVLNQGNVHLKIEASEYKLPADRQVKRPLSSTAKETFQLTINECGVNTDSFYIHYIL